MIGTIINDRYRIDAELGQGGMGTVYQAHDTALDRDVAIKLVSNPQLGAEGRTRLLREAQTIAKLKHPNIVAVHDVGEHEEQPYIVMEYIQGITLDQHLINNIEDTLDITRQICLALDHAHSQEIIHRDLKPENIIVEPGGTVRLMDFGLALSTASRLTTEGDITGTVFYMSPEQAIGDALDPTTDLYSLGVMLYEIVTGELPFNAPNAIVVITQHIHAPVVPPIAKKESIPGYLNNLILNLLEKSPTDRPRSAQAIIDLLENPQDQAAPEAGEELSVLDRIVRGRIIGRQEELDQAKSLWTSTLADDGQLVLISGEPGIGKTRFMKEIITQAEVSGGQSYIGECHPEGNMPYSAFAQIIRRALHKHENNGLELPQPVLAELLELIPELKTNYPEVELNPPLDPEAEQQRLFEHMITFCKVMSKNAPLLLVIEDVHWADGSTLAMMNQLARRTQEMPVMLIGTYREVELDEALPFHQTIQDLNRQNLGSRISLKRLDKEKTRNLLAIIFDEEITDAFLEGIYKETEGNPFFIEEVCKALVESGQLVFEDGKWDHPSMEELQIPQGIKVAVQSRLTKLSQETQDILLFAAVIGRVFDYPTLEKISEKDEAPLFDALEEAIRNQVIEEVRGTNGEEFNFSHALITFTLRESVIGLRRARLHHKVAAAIEETTPDNYERLAHHWDRANDEDKALDYTIKAAQRASQSYANQEAIQQYSHALALLSEGDAQRYPLLAERAAVYSIIGQYDDLTTDAKSMLAIADKENDPEKKMQALLLFAEAALAEDVTQVIGFCEQVIEIAEPMDAKGYLGQAYHFLGNHARQNLQGRKAMDNYKKADSLLQSAGLTKLATENLSDLIWLLGFFDPQAGLELAQKNLEISKATGDKLLEASATLSLVVAQRLNLMGPQSLETVQVALDLSRAIGARRDEGIALRLRGIIFRALKRFAQAEQDFHEALKIAQEINDETGQISAVTTLTTLYMNSLGEYEKALSIVSPLLKDAKKQNMKLAIYWFSIGLTIIYLKFGQYQLAIDNDLDILENMQDMPLSVQGLRCALLSISFFQLGEFDQGQSYLDRALAIDEANDFDSLQKYNIWANIAYATVSHPAAYPLQDLLVKLESFLQEYRDAKAHHNVHFLLYHVSRVLLALADQDPSNLEKALTYLAEAEELEKNFSRPTGIVEIDLFLHVRAHRAAGQDDKADDHLKKAHEWVTNVAEKITNPDFRKAYLENVPDVVAILEAYQERFGE